MIYLILAVFIQLSFAQDQTTCTGPIGNVVTCNQAIKEFKCDYIDAAMCGGTVININNPTKDFYIKAEDDNIAIGTTFNVLFDNSMEPITSIEGVLAGGDESLCESTVIITNNQIDTTLNMKVLEFNGDWSGDKFTLIMQDGPGSKGITLGKTVCGDNGLSCTLKSSAISDAVDGATPNCLIITIAADGTQTGTYSCLEAYQLELSIATSAVPLPPPAAMRNNLESELDQEYESINDSDDEKKITIQFSEAFMINLWAMISVFILLNIGAFCCYKRQMIIKSSQQRVFTDQV